MRLGVITIDLLDGYWDLVKPYLSAVVDMQDKESLDDIHDFIVQDEYNLWALLDNEDVIGTLITTIIDYPKKRVLHMTYLSGDNIAPHFNTVFNTMKDFGRDNGCDYVEFQGRKGWERVWENVENIRIDSLYSIHIDAENKE